MAYQVDTCKEWAALCSKPSKELSWTVWMAVEKPFQRAEQRDETLERSIGIAEERGRKR